MNVKLIETAKKLSVHVGALDALLVPMAAGGRDGNGRPMPMGQETMERLQDRMQDAWRAIAIAHKEVFGNDIS